MSTRLKTPRTRNAQNNNLSPPSPPLHTVALAHGLFYLITGIWPLVHMRSFIVVTGPKVDLWLVKTVGLLITVVGAVLTLAAWQRRVSSLIALLATGCAVALTAIDIIYVAKRRIRPVYLLDAVAECALIAGWLLAGKRQNAP